ncbi:MAG: hypothetical protein ACYTF3_07585, partial [Planctomycetota bacterium]
MNRIHLSFFLLVSGLAFGCSEGESGGDVCRLPTGEEGACCLFDPNAGRTADNLGVCLGTDCTDGRRF